MARRMLMAKALKIYAVLSPKITDDYQSLKSALLSGFNKTTDSYRDNFKAVRIGSGETYQQFVVQLGHLFDHWFYSCGIPKSFEDLRKFSLLISYLVSCLYLCACTLKNRTSIYYVTLLKFVITGPLLTRVTKVLLVIHLHKVRVLARCLHKVLQKQLLILAVPRLPTQLVIEVFVTVVEVRSPPQILPV